MNLAMRRRKHAIGDIVDFKISHVDRINISPTILSYKTIDN